MIRLKGIRIDPEGESPRERRETIRWVCERGADAMGVTRCAIFGRCREQHLAWLRQVTYYVAHVGLGYAMIEIGRAIGRDHSTVSYGVRQVERRLDRRHEHTRVQVRAVCAAVGLHVPQPGAPVEWRPAPAIDDTRLPFLTLRPLADARP